MPVSIKGSGGGSVTLDAGAAASDTTLTLPNASGTVIYSNSSGNVGIGTSNPKSPLQVNGAVTLQSYYMTYLVNSYYDGAWRYVENGMAWGIGNNFGGPTNGVAIGLASVNAGGAAAALTWTTPFVIGSSGQIGIGGANYGTSGQVLTSGGASAAPSWASPASTGITLATAVATTSGTSFDFTGIPSTVKRITVIFSGVQMNASGATAFLVQLGTSSGIETSGYVSIANVLDSTGGSSGTSSTAGFAVFSNSTSGLLGGSMTINLISGNSWVENHTAQAGDNVRTVLGGGTKATAATLDRVRLTSTSGTATFTAGSVTIQYE
jgi:hypothetical protein